MKTFYASLGAEEKRYIIVGSILLTAILGYFLGYEPLALKNTKLQSAVHSQTEEMLWMQQAQLTLAKQPVTPVAAASTKPLLVVVDQTIQQAGLKELLKRIQPEEGGTTIRVWLEQAPFANLVQWLDDLQRRHGIIVSTAGIERQQQAGTVNAKFVLTTAGNG